MSATDRYAGLLTDQILTRALDELRAIEEDFAHPDESHNDTWLARCEGRLTNALEDLTFVRNAFRKAQT